MEPASRAPAPDEASDAHASLDSLTDDLLRAIAALLDPQPLSALSQTCRRWRDILSTESFTVVWLWPRASLCSAAHNAQLCTAFTSARPPPPISLCEKLCLWASESQRADQQTSAELLSLNTSVTLWVLKGLCRTPDGLSLLQWLLSLEAEAIGGADEGDSASTEGSHYWLCEALMNLARNNQHISLDAVLGPDPWHTLKLAGSSGPALVYTAWETNSTETVTICVQRLCSSEAKAAQAVKRAVLHAAGNRAAQEGCLGVLEAVLEHTWGDLGKLQITFHLCPAAARGGRVDAARLLLGCTCGPTSQAADIPTRGSTQQPHQPPCNSHHHPTTDAQKEHSAVCTSAEQPQPSGNAVTSAKKCPAMVEPVVAGMLEVASTLGNWDVPDGGATVALPPTFPAPQGWWAGHASGAVRMAWWLVCHMEPATRPERLRAYFERAAQRGNSDILLLLCEASIALDGTCPDLSFAINTSMVGAHHALLPLLLQNGIISRAAYVERLHRYAQEGDAEAVVGLVEGVGLGRVGNGQPQLSQQEVAGALRLAEDVGQERVLQEILRRVKPGSLPASQVTYLITEATRAGHSRIATALLTWDAGHTEGLLLAALKSAIWAGQVTCSQDILADTTHTASVLGTQSQHGKLETMPDSDWEAALMQALHADKPECADVVLSAWREQHAALQRQPGCLARDMHQQAVAVTKALVRGLEGSVGLRYPQMARWFHGRLMDVSRPEWEKTVVEETLEAGARTILSKAVFMGQTELLAHFLDHCTVLSRAIHGPIGTQLVTDAAEMGYIESVRVALVRGADSEGSTLLLAASEGHDQRLSVLLSAAYMQADQQTTDTTEHCPWDQPLLDTALIQATESNQLPCVELLIHHGASVPTHSHTLVPIACHVGSLKLLRVLLDAGADPKHALQGDMQSLAARGLVDMVRLIQQGVGRAGCGVGCGVGRGGGGGVQMGLATGMSGVADTVSGVLTRPTGRP